jgi:cell division protease FtsH
MDGFDGRKGIIIMSATNRPETLDQALLRAGRFDRHVVVDPPDVRGREAILLVHARGMRLDPSIDMREVAQRTSGFTGADLANALNEAALLAARRAKDMITFSEIDEAVERLSLGVERKSRRISDEERKMTAYHEAGHALCAAASEHSFPVQKISIIPRGMTGGVTRFTPPEGRIGATRSELLARLTMGLGGLAAEAEFIGDVTTGAKSDIAMCSATARSMITEYGMSDRLGAVHYGSDRPNALGGASRDVVISDVTAREIDAEVRRMIDEAQERAQSIMRQNRDLMSDMANYLMEHEVMDGDTLKEFTGRVRKLTLVPQQTTG